MTLFSSSLMLNEIAEYLQTSTSLGSMATDIFVGLIPSTPATCVGLYADAGTALPGDPVVRPGLQVLVRSSTYLAAHTNAEVAFNAIQNKTNVLSTVQGRFVPNHEVGPFYRDGNSNIIFTLNFSFTGVRGT